MTAVGQVVVTHLFAGIPVRDYASALRWYERLLGRPPDRHPTDEEAVWQITEQASVYVVTDERRAGQALVTIAVDNLEQHLHAMTQRGLPEAAIERSAVPLALAVITDPEGNRVQVFQDPAAAREAKPA